VHAEELGDPDASPLILLHSGGSGYRPGRWDEGLRRLAHGPAGWRLIRYDRPGYGLSGAREDAFAPGFFERDARDLAVLVERTCQGERPVLVGSSDGGTVAMIHAAAHPERLRSLVCEGAHSYADPRLMESLVEMRRKFIRRHGAEPREGESPAVQRGRQWCATWSHPRWRDWSILPSLERIRCPVLIVQGERDGIVGDEHAERTARAVGSGARCVILRKGEHICHRSHPEEYYSLLEEFLRSSQGGRSAAASG